MAPTSLALMAWSSRVATYTCIGVITGIVYDYVLTFANEVEYIWNRPWTWVSFLYILVRYLGCYLVISKALSAVTFIRFPVEVGYFHRVKTLVTLEQIRRYAIYVLNQFIILLFFAAADVVMILRAWVIYNRSRLIISVLLLIFILDIVISIVIAVLSSISAKAYIAQVPDLASCSGSDAFYIWATYTVILQFIPAAVTCILVVAQFVRQTLQMYRATKRWQLNRYINLLARQGIVYFIVMLTFGFINLFINLQTKYSGFAYIQELFISCYLPVFAFIPHIILSMRSLYSRDNRGRRGPGIDTGFGISSPSNPDTVLVFANVEQNERSEWEEEILMDGEGTEPARNDDSSIRVEEC